MKLTCHGPHHHLISTLLKNCGRFRREWFWCNDESVKLLWRLTVLIRHVLLVVHQIFHLSDHAVYI